MSIKKYPVDVEMKLNISLGDETEKTINTLNDFSTKMANLIRLTQNGAATTGNLTDNMIKADGQMINTSKVAEHYIKIMGAEGKSAKDLNKETKLLRAATGQLNAVLGASNAQAKLASKGVSDFDDALTKFKGDPTEEQLGKIVTMYKSFSTDAGGASVALDSLRKSFSRAGPVMSQDFMKGLSTTFGDDVGKMIQYINELDQAMGRLNGRTQFLKQVFADPTQMEQFTQSLEKSQLEMYKLSIASQFVVGKVGAVRMAALDLGRSFFWTGLGTMFALMSFQRYASTGTQIKAGELSLTRALQSEQEAMEKLNRYKASGITTGKSYAEASMAAKEATVSRKLAEDRLRDSIINQKLAFAQLVFGTIPTAIRTTIDMTLELMKMFVTMNMNTAATNENSVAQEINSVAKQASTVTIWGYTISTAAATVATLALTTALTFGASALLTMMASAEATDSISKANDEFSKMKNTLTVRHSPALYEAFPLLANGMNQTNYSMKVLGTTLNTTIGEFSNLKRVQNEAVEGFNEMTKAVSQYTEVSRTLMQPISRKPSALILPKQRMEFPQYRPEVIQPGPTSLGGIMGSTGMNLSKSPINQGVSINQNPLSKGMSGLTINMNGPVSLKDDKDITKLGDRIVSSIYRRGG